jgi:hypothetical protein
MKISNKQEFFKHIRKVMPNKQRQDANLQQIVDVLDVVQYFGFKEIPVQVLSKIKTYGVEVGENNYVAIVQNIQLDFNLEPEEYKHFCHTIANDMGCYDAADFFRDFSFK